MLVHQTDQTTFLKRPDHSSFSLTHKLNYSVFWAETNEIQSVSVMEGDSVLLHTNVTEIDKNDHIDLKFGANNSLIAKILRKELFFIFDVPDGRFRDRLKLDDQTGSLIITNTRTEHTGVYEVLINGAKMTTKTFNVSVYARLPVPVITRNSSQCSSSNCSLMCSVLNVSDATLSWYAGMSVLSSISVCDLSISLSLPLEVEYQDKNTYSCVLNNPISNQTTHLDINTLCHTCAEPDTHTPSQQDSLLIVLISAGSLLMVALVIGIFCICRKRKNLSIQTFDEEITYAETTFYKENRHKPKVEEEGHVVYAPVAMR
ncbi:SLAM family member 9-like [Siphateles boraxobius]|uniref:SLAM family member 9-like n=1 Tax=Siphateles boraxobius TaxID=180520 RepID=UPI004064535D